MATHFDGRGHPNGWSSREVFFMIYFGALILVYVSVIYFPKRLMQMPKKYLNIPNKDKITDEQLVTFRAFITRQMEYFGLATIGFVMVVMQLCIQANFLDQPNLSGAFMWFFIPYMSYVLIWTIWIVRKSYSITKVS
jgi:uncharacterized membrane protein